MSRVHCAGIRYIYTYCQNTFCSFFFNNWYRRSFNITLFSGIPENTAHKHMQRYCRADGALEDGELYSASYRKRAKMGSIFPLTFSENYR